MKDLDKQAYLFIRDWPALVNFNPVYQEIDYSQIIRFYIWDKVGRALRLKNKGDNAEVTLYLEDYNCFPFYYTAKPSYGKYRKKSLTLKKRVFVPFLNTHTHELILDLKNRKDCEVLSKFSLGELEEEDIIQEEKVAIRDDWYLKLFNALSQALELKGISLIPEDKELLKEQLKGAILISEMAEKELKTNKPNRLYVYSDNHPPFINYVLAAKKMGIPTFTYQHGLDCEHYLLDDCYADYVAVWSAHRKNRYLEESRFQPKKIKVIGNALMPQILNSGHSKVQRSMLYITRPHHPVKCYSPYRTHLEGKEILQVLINFLKKNEDVFLIIKPHPMDLVRLYENQIKDSGIRDRIRIVSEDVHDLFKNVAVVITEDSTAGAESMYYKLPCIHAHFTKGKPVLPFIEYGAALPGRSRDEFKQSLQKIFNLSDEEKKTMWQAQEKIVTKFLPIGEIESLSNFILNKK